MRRHADRFLTVVRTRAVAMLPGWRRRPAYLVVAATLVISVVTALGIVELQRHADSYRQTEILATDFRGEFANYNGKGHGVVLGQRNVIPLLTELTKASGNRSQQLLDKMASANPNDEQIVQLRETFLQYQVVMSELLGLVTSQGIGEARAMSAQRLDPLNEAIDAASGDLIARYRDRAQQANRNAYVGSLLALLGAGGAVGLLLWLVERARRSSQLAAVEQRALQASEERFRTLIQHATDLITVFEADGTIRYQSPSIERILGPRPDEIVGKAPADFLSPEDLEPVEALLAHALSAPGVRPAIELHARHRDGSLRQLEAVANNLLSDPAVAAIVVTAHDITERTRAEVTLREAEARYRELFDNAHDAIYTLDLHGRFTGINQAMARLHGYPPEAILGRHIRDFMAPEYLPQARDVAVRLAAGEAISSFEFEIIAQQGQRVLVEASVRSLYQAGVQIGVQGIARDITERKQTELALQQAKDEAERANQAKNEFLSRTSHELRTPLNAILGFAQLLEIGTLNPQQQAESVGYILTGGRHLLRLINEVLDIARIESGRIELSVEPVPLDQAMQESFDLMSPLAAGRDVRLTLDAACLPGRHVLADRQRLQQVLLNLLTNAIKYNRDNGTVTFACAPAESGHARIIVADTGPGIPADKLGRLFTPFDRLGADQTTVEGTGLGLALSERLVKAMGGRIGVESAPGQGCTFWVELPLVEAQLEQIQRLGTPAAPTKDTEPVADHTVLYIEDNLSNLKLVEWILKRREGIRLIPAMQGSLGLELAFEHRPDLVLLDLHLPDMPGAEVLRRLKADPHTAGRPVVVLSADATSSSTERLLAAGAHAYLSKPLDVPRFDDLLDELLQRRPYDRAQSA
jgi:PAS domain S-box-containing protein